MLSREQRVAALLAVAAMHSLFGQMSQTQAAATAAVIALSTSGADIAMVSSALLQAASQGSPALVGAVQLLLRPPRPRSIYRKARDHWWWENQMCTFYNDKDFKLRMRANRSTFQELVDYLRGSMEKTKTNWKTPIAVDKRIAAGLYHIGNGGTLQMTADKFDMSLSLFQEIFKEFLEAVICKMGSLLSWPKTTAAMERVIHGFYKKRHLPGCCGAIDCTHVLITSPDHEDTRPYIDRSGHKSVILQAVVDFQGSFMDVFAGWPGSVHDQRVTHSLLHEHITRRGLLNGPVYQVQAKEISPWLVGDAGYTLEPWMIVPYPGQNLNGSKFDFNFRQSSTRIIVEQAFGRLKGRFRLLNGIVQVADSDRHSDILVAACILHNFMMSMNDKYDSDWTSGVRLRCSGQSVHQHDDASRLDGADVRELLRKESDQYGI